MTALQLALNYTRGTATGDLLADPAVRDVLGASLSSLLRGVFDCMEIAEQEIATAKRQTRDAATRERIEDAFRYLSPTELLRGKHSDLYRAHARELIVRVAARTDLRPGTDAEALAVLCESSLIAPLNPVATLLYARLFRSVFPATTALHFEAAYGGTDYYERQADALLATTRRKLDEAAARLGLTKAEIRARYGPRRKRKPRAPKYRNPENPTETWSGRGKRPAWVEAHLTRGGKLADLSL